jgi:hypothetical protein
MKSRESIQDVSTRIRGLTQYGMREVRFEAPGYTLTWSNNAAAWGRSYYQHKQGEVVKLDANQTVAYVSKKELDDMLPLLPDLPLYGNSFEVSSGRGRAPKRDENQRCNCSAPFDIPDSEFDANELRLGIEEEITWAGHAGRAKMMAKLRLSVDPHYYSKPHGCRR